MADVSSSMFGYCSWKLSRYFGSKPSVYESNRTVPVMSAGFCGSAEVASVGVAWPPDPSPLHPAASNATTASAATVRNAVPLIAAPRQPENRPSVGSGR
jgi:hypothetical protein